MMDQQAQAQGPQFSPTQPISVTLDAQTWQTVINQLMEGQYKVMAPIIGSIIAQFAKPQPGPLIVGEGPPPGYVAPASMNGTGADAPSGGIDGEANSESTTVPAA